MKVPLSAVRVLGRATRSWLPWAIAGGLSLPVFWPFYREGLPRSFDGGLHLLRLGLLDIYIREGALYPRWSPDQILGFGYPLFSYYAPGSYYLAEALHLLGLSFYAAFVAAFVLFILAGGAGMARLAWDIFEGKPWPAALAALVYVYSPYLITNTYIRGALAEVAAQALLPWIVWSARRLIHRPGDGRAVLPLAFSLAALAVTHNITLLFTPPLLLAYMVTLWLMAGRPRPALGRTALALCLAMGLSAFFWLPLLLESDYIANTGFDIARSVWLPASAWTPANFLDGGLTYEHTFARPIRLGLLQLLVAVAGMLAARRRDAEWLFWCAAALVTGLLMTAWALPLWQSSDLLTLAQFTWRLLSIHSLALALLAGGLLAWTPKRPIVLAGVGLLLMLLVTGGERPRLAWIDVFAPESVDVTRPVLAQTEVEKGVLGGGEGNSSIQEFRPRWAPMTLAADSETFSVPERQIAVTAAGSHALSAQITSEAPGPLRFAAFYFPGWQAWLDGTPQQTYPSGDTGLLTVDLPAGEHRLELRWQGTPLQQAAGMISLAILAACLVLAVVERRAGFGVLATVGLLMAVSAYAITPNVSPVVAAHTSPQVGGLQLLGYQVEQQAGRLYLRPYWLALSDSPADLKVQWTLHSMDGAPIAEVNSRPYHNALPASVWSRGTLVDDGYVLTLPQALPAGSYRLSIGDPLSGKVTPLGEISLAATPITTPSALAPLDVRLGEQAHLTGYHYEIDRNRPGRGAALPVVQAGGYVRVHLAWQADQPLDKNLHGFVHLVDPQGTPLVQEDQLPGPFFQPPTIWTNNQIAPDVYLLRLPHDAASGVYYPRVGLYDFATLDRLPVTWPQTDSPADAYALPPLKVVGPSPDAPGIALDYHLGDLAAVTGVTIEPAAGAVAPGGTLTVTLVYETLRPTSSDLTRFVQLLDDANRVVSQHDSLPAGGRNPTWAWLEGEMVEDRAMLHISSDTPPGRYRLVAGLYDASAGGARLPVTVDGVPVPEQWVALGSVQIAASP